MNAPTPALKTRDIGHALNEAGTDNITYVIPQRIMGHQDVNQLLHHAVKLGASDIYIIGKRRVRATIQGDMVVLTHRRIDESEQRVILNTLCQRESATTDISAGRAVNTSYKLAVKVDNGNALSSTEYRYFRVNAVPVNPHNSEITLRLINQTPPTLQSVDLKAETVRGFLAKHGMFLVCGVTGSGKTTTFAAIIRYILENETVIHGHILTHEEPIEYRYDQIKSQHSLIVQSQIPEHFPSFPAANREAMRRRPSLLLVGELRDLETIQSALEIGRTGHAVFSTVHATDVASVPQRLVSRYPQENQREAMYDIIDTIHGLLSQRLIKAKDGKLVAIREYIVLTRDLKDDLLALDDQSRISQRLREMVRSHGWTFSQDAKRLLDAGIIEQKVAEDIIRSKS